MHVKSEIKFSLTEHREKDVVCTVRRKPGRTERRPGFSQGSAQSKITSDSEASAHQITRTVVIFMK